MTGCVEVGVWSCVCEGGYVEVGVWRCVCGGGFVYEGVFRISGRSSITAHVDEMSGIDLGGDGWGGEVKM